MDHYSKFKDVEEYKNYIDSELEKIQVGIEAFNNLKDEGVFELLKSICVKNNFSK